MKKIGSPLAAMISLLLLAGCGGQPSQAPAPAPAPSDAPAPSHAPTSKSKPELKTQVLNCPAPGSGLDSKVELDGAVYGAVKTGDLAVAVTKVQVATEVGPNTAQGQYVIVTLGMQNHGSERAFTGLVSDFVVISEGKRYRADGLIGMKYRDLAGERSLTSLNPELSGIDSLVYDMPKTHDPCQAQIEITRRPDNKSKATYLLPVGIAKQ